jgi:hypothetical protein
LEQQPDERREPIGAARTTVGKAAFTLARVSVN